MKKDLIFAPILIIIGVLLFLLKSTGINAHIGLSVAGLVALIVYAILTKKNWKKPVLEIGMRVFYGIALLTGIALMNVHGIAVLGEIHRLSAVVFAVLLVVLFITKIFAKKSK